MNGNTRRCFVCTVACSLVIVTPGHAVLPQEPPIAAAAQAKAGSSSRTAANYFPADTLALARIGNVAQFRQTWQNSSFGAQAADPALHRFFASVLAKLSRRTEDLGPTVNDLWGQLDGEISLAAIKNPQGRVSVVAVAELADDAAAGQLVARLEKQLAAEDADLTTVELGPTRLRSWRRPRDRNLANVTYFAEGRRVVFGEDIETLAVTAQCGRDAQTQTLSANQDFRHVMTRIAPGGNRSGINWYVNPAAIVDAVYLPEGGPPERLQEMIGSLGLDQVRGIGGTVWLGQGGMDSVSTTYGFVQTPLSGPLKALSLPATPQRPPDWVKEDVSLYAQINWSVDRFVGTLREIVDNSRGAGAFDNSLGSLKVSDGATLADIARAIDGPVHIATDIPQDARQLLQQRAVLGFGISNPEPFRRLSRGFAESRQTATEQVGGAELVRMRIDLAQALPGAEAVLGVEPQLEFGVAVTNDTVLVSPNPAYLAEVVAGRSNLRPLAESPEYRQIARQFPERTSMITFQRQDGRLEGLYEQLRGGLLGSAGIPGFAGGLTDFDFRALPPFSSMSRYLQTTGSFIVPETDGFRVVSMALPPRER